ncbi:putative PTS IIA-like nitrogen-regulatory protein PtsN [Coriobacterium glomerans PW2]|uniref:PTS IIA-like nitrogen-regulatory protein PtsN n=1 Tax=Coriobacterium glomerans (strain ATCC 49209 / DSM 20642 / JCM 10262 / PW2) TaxID=700015 RepID=F2N8J5_CORGP|nr:PTS sugar transporter subunit IIA [Coriobacterium glomerans]AEB07378.1 putative PTS IIA-like nitrogen-regulatory protein PtsN [Coriobacterium glomerans PW2]
MTSLLHTDLIILDAEVASAEEAIRLMGDRLEKLGFVTEGYADMVCDREKTYPTGLPGASWAIALPHTDPTLVIRPAVGVIVPREPVEFKMMGAPDTTLDVRLIMPLVIKDANSQLSLLKTMMGVIADAQLLERIRRSRDPREIIELLRPIECDEPGRMSGGTPRPKIR